MLITNKVIGVTMCPSVVNSVFFYSDTISQKVCTKEEEEIKLIYQFQMRDREGDGVGKIIQTNIMGFERERERENIVSRTQCVNSRAIKKFGLAASSICSGSN